jgi:aspartyl protease family protein
MFVLDATNSLAWAVEGEGDADLREQPKAKLWGLLTPSDVVPLREIRGWLAQHHVPEGSVSFVPLPDSVAQLYKRPRKTVAKIEAPESLSESKTQDAPMKPNLPEPPSGEHLAIPLQREGGTFVVPVSINGEITLKFTIDSGAADVSIPADVVMTLLRTGTLTREDFLGTQTYRLADGSTVPSQTFRIRSLKVGDRVVENVTGSVASVAGTLLLGQCFLSRFKSWSIDNQRQVLLLD